MQSLHSLIRSLTPSEVKVVRNYLTGFSSRQGEDSIKTLALFDYLYERVEVPPAKNCCIHIYGSVRREKDVFFVLKHRLKNKILDALLTDLNEDKRDMLDEVDYAFVQMKKRSAQFQQLFYSKDNLIITHEIIDEIISTCKKYEFFSNLVEHLNYKKRSFAYRHGKKEVEKIDKEILFYERCSQCYTLVMNYYYDLKMLYEYEGNKNAGVITAFLKDAIVDIAVRQRKINSPIINYFLKYLELDYCLNLRDYSKARQTGLQLVEIINKHKSVYRRQRIGIVYDTLAVCEMHTGDFSAAVAHARHAHQFFGSNSFNCVIALECEFNALFYNKKYQEAEEAARTMLNSASRQEMGEFRFAKYTYLYACVLFRQRKFSQALALLSQRLEISKDKAGWEMGLRILTILTAIEMQELDKASSLVESLKKFVQYNEKRSRQNGLCVISSRDKLILSILLQLERSGFVFSQLNDRSGGLLEKLADTGGEYSWVVLSPEMIPFHEWLEEKIQIKHAKPKPVSFI